MNIKWEVLKLQVHCKLLTGGCLKIKFFIMKAVFQSFFLFLLLSEIVLGQEQVHGFFKFIGFFNEPQVSSMINKIHNKSRRECSSECLKYENCYFFDFCKTGSSISCYFYNNNIDNNSDLENGMCRRYELVSTDLLYYFITFEFPNQRLNNIHDYRFNGVANHQTQEIFFAGYNILSAYLSLLGPRSVNEQTILFYSISFD